MAYISHHLPCWCSRCVDNFFSFLQFLFNRTSFQNSYPVWDEFSKRKPLWESRLL